MATKKILLVIDVQNDFITGALRNEEAIKKLPNIVNLIKTEKFDKVYVTMDTHDKNYLKDTLEGKKLPVEHCILNTNGWNMSKEVADELIFKYKPDVFRKSTFGSVSMAAHIYATLSNDIANMGEYEFTIVGFCTDICVVSNALLLRAYLPNNRITVVEDCVAGTSKEAHDAAILTMKMNQIDVI